MPRNRWQDENRTRKKSAIAMLKLEMGCQDCGYNTDPTALEFDHLPGYVKVARVARLVGDDSPIEKVLSEIEKCECVCANCHRVRTANRGTT